jgi:cytidylate kinase
MGTDREGVDQPVIALVGPTAAGKSTVASILSERWGFAWAKSREVIRGLASADESASLQEIGAGLMSESAAIAFADAVAALIGDKKGVVDSIRPRSHLVALRKLGRPVYLVGVTAITSVRRDRFERRAPGEDFDARERSHVESEIPSLLADADFIIHNDPPRDLPGLVSEMLGTLGLSMSSNGDSR